MNIIRNLFYSQEVKPKASYRVKIFVDTIKTRTKQPLLIDVKNEMTIKNIRKLVALNRNVNMDDIVMLINFRFWEDDTFLVNILKEMNASTEAYVCMYAVVITPEEADNIDFDVEAHLKQKYSVPEEPENDFVLTKDSDLDLYSEDLMKIAAVCCVCNVSKQRDFMIVLDYCGHEYCKDCSYKIVKSSFGMDIKCTHNQCHRCLFDHEVQKILGIEKYKMWEKDVERKFLSDSNFIIPKIGWICGSCTFVNKPFFKFCDTCNENCPTDYKIPIFYKVTDEDKVIQLKEAEKEKMLEEDKKQQELEKNKRLEEIKKIYRQSVTYTSEATECPVCLMEYEAKEAIVLHSCLHTICKECLHNYLLNIENALVKCPTENCSGFLEDREIGAILTREEFNKYQELSLRMAEAKEKLSFHCKAINCQGWIVHDGLLQHFNCPTCKTKNCIRCEAIHYSSCEDYQKAKLSVTPDPSQTKNDIFIQSLIDSGSAMKCPGCKVIVEKNRGCDGVLCRNCGMMICWATKGPRWGPKGKGDTSGGCGCRFFWGRRCHWSCRYCH